MPGRRRRARARKGRAGGVRSQAANGVTSAAATPIPRTRAAEHACVLVSKRIDVVVAVLGIVTVRVRVVVVGTEAVRMSV